MLSPSAYEKRIAEIRAENARARAATRKCSKCDCSAYARCGLVRISENESALCGFIPGHDACACCLQPERRIPMVTFVAPTGFAPSAAADEAPAKKRRTRKAAQAAGGAA